MPDASKIQAGRYFPDHNEFFAGLFFLGCANGIAARAVAAVHRNGLLNALIDMFDISAIELAACSLGLWLMMDGGKRLITSADVVVGVVALVSIASPFGGLSWIAVSGVAAYVLWSTDADLPLRRGALILLAVTFSMFWSPLLLRFFTDFILQIDASLVGWVLGTERTGNMVRLADGGGYLVIFPPCSSLANVSLAFLCWITISEFAGHRRDLTDLWWCLLACGSVVAINVVRLSIMGISVRHYSALHSQTGGAVISVMLLVVMVGWSIMGVRRELFSEI